MLQYKPYLLREAQFWKVTAIGYLIKVVVMALAGEVAQELSPIVSWSNEK